MEEKKSISDKIKELDMAVDWFYSDEFSLDTATEKYKSAIKLAKEIETDLDSLKNEITVIQKDFTKE
ncbi:exodeoxyribonuclease VII small subunit [Candidatus Saccharibacteria bacterium]|nr:exodeoxyribonuclease VII small subunit [Candidatus Saccharibacteria bacterium]